LARLGRTAEERRRNYRELVMQAVDPEETDTIRRHLNISTSTAPTASALQSNGS
jgi:hypothetical protein